MQPQPQKPPLMKNAATAPVVFFDVAPAYGTVNGACMIELAAPVVMPQPDGAVHFEMICVAKLRCAPAALGSLKQAVDQLMTMVAQPPTSVQN